MNRNLLMSLAFVNVILSRQFKLKRHCISLFIRGWKESRRLIYNSYLVSERHADSRGLSLWQGGTFNSEFYNGNDRFSCEKFDHGNFCGSVRTKKACFPFVACPFFLGKKKVFARRKSLPPTRETMARFFLSRRGRWTLRRKMARSSCRLPYYICFVAISFSRETVLAHGDTFITKSFRSNEIQ